MNSKFFIAGLLGTATSFLMGFLVYGNLLMDMMINNTMAGTSRSPEEFQWLFLVLSNLASGFFLAYVFSKWANVTTFSRGLSNGAVIGLFVSLIYDFAFYATTKLATLNWYLVDILATIVITGIIGGVVAWWLGRGK